MPRKYVVPQDGTEGAVEDDEAPGEIDDPGPALQACLVLMMSCPKCEGTGATGSSKNPTRCDCRDTAFAVALAVLEQEGLA